MRTATLVRRGLTHYRRTHAAVVVGVATAVAVLAGALLVGDSVRGTLRDMAGRRLGRTDVVVSSGGFFRERLADDLREDPDVARDLRATTPLIVLEGFVTHEPSRRRAEGVQVYGVDDRFWAFHGVAPPAGGGERDAAISPALARDVGAGAGDTLLVRVQRPSAIPVDSLHGRKDEVGRTVRVTVRATLPAERLGEFSLRLHQAEVRAIFVPLARLQKDLDRAIGANTILISARPSGGSGDPPAPDQGTADELDPRLGAAVRRAATLEDYGLRVRALPERRALSLESDSGIISDAVAEVARSTAAGTGMRVLPVLTYLANTIGARKRSIPYSLVTAIDQTTIGVATGGASGGDGTPILLNDWAAADLDVHDGDRVTIEYYVWEDDGRLVTRTADFRAAGVLPLRGPAADRDLTPQYPGLTDARSLSEWEAPFPIDLRRIRPRDDEYWARHGATPKAFVPLEAGQKLWASRYGRQTSIRIVPPEAVELDTALQRYRAALRASLDPGAAGLIVVPARARALEAAGGATDFGEYFLYFSLFIVVSAVLLAALFFRLGVEQRAREVGLLGAVGFPAAVTRRLLVMEGAVLAAIGSSVGVAGAVGYGAVMVHGLRTWWAGATGTAQLTLHVAPQSLAIGAAAGMITAVASIAWTVRRLVAASPRSLLAGQPSTFSPSRAGFAAGATGGRAMASAAACWVLATGFVTLAWMEVMSPTAAFFGAGTLLLVGTLCALAAWIRGRKPRIVTGHGWWPVARLGIRVAAHRPAQALLGVALIASATFIIVSIEAFRRDGAIAAGESRSGTGGFSLTAQSLLPIAYDLNSVEGRDALGFDRGGAVQAAKFFHLRLRPGDDASCLNLYRPQTPRILAPEDGMLAAGRFAFAGSEAATGSERHNPWLLLHRRLPDGIVPVIADANSIAYVLHRKVGDQFVLDTGAGQAIRMRIVAALADSIFQSELLMSEANFRRLFPDQHGYRVFLVDTPVEQALAVGAILEDRLADFGFDAVMAAERLEAYHRVENTYLSTFQALGGLGLALGTIGLGALLWRNVLERGRELALLQAVGYRPADLRTIVVAESAFLLFWGIFAGTVSALVAIAPALSSRTGPFPVGALAALLGIVAAAGLTSSLVAASAASRAPLLRSLRTE